MLSRVDITSLELFKEASKWLAQPTSLEFGRVLFNLGVPLFALLIVVLGYYLIKGE